MTVGITGPTGGLGSAIVDEILNRSLVPTSDLILITRDESSAKAKEYAAKGAQVRKGDFGDVSTLGSAFKGVDSLLIMAPGHHAGPHGVKYQIDAIEAAHEAGVSKFYLVSNVAAKAKSDFSPAEIHYEVEQHLEKKGYDFVSLRNGFYLSVVDTFLGNALKSGTLTAPPDGQIAWIDRDELGQAAAHIITGKYKTNGKYVDLVGSKSWTLKDAADILSKVTGKEIKRQEVEPQAFTDGAIAAGVPEMWARLTTAIATCAHDGDWSKTSGLVEEILGHKNKSLEEYIEAQYANKA
ncbi:hypothetical protein BD324DRAFT_633479 [Kockovaella imperatae]|uniref:NmrA-like domain-containing protein n=1 Tax=Kockovaella imperatae TaxID=4999 RepID=A0A1Y1UAD3_9TREE|nr:hypothetical protein BD324DRAFT_633479 [Kockovaella imperatae]ORX34979.1 hypothetical protein BD324DRAFT_633479 [Kockovaella imperatae]